MVELSARFAFDIANVSNFLSDLGSRLRYAWNDHRPYFGAAAGLMALVVAFYVGTSTSGAAASKQISASANPADVAANHETQAPPVVTATPAVATPTPSAPKVAATPAPAVTVYVTAPPTPSVVSSPAPAIPSSVTVQGSLTESEVLTNDISPTAGCSSDGIKLAAKDSTGSIAALASFSQGALTDVKQDEYSLSFTCTYPYTVTLPANSPVYTFDAYEEQVDTITPWITTVDTATLIAGQAPKPYLSFCAGC